MAKKFKPKFAGNGVQIDGPPVDAPEGKGLQQVSSNNDACCGVESQSDKDMVDHGLLNGLGDDLIETDAMCDVDKNGVENKPQGVKVPGHAKPKDGFTQPLKHNHENSIAEGEEKPFEERVAEMMDGGAVAMKEDDTIDEEGDLTMEQLFESYLEECGETASYEEFADHCDDAGYEQPSLDDTQSMMGDHEGYMFTPVGNGLYKKEAVPQTVGIEDLPGGPNDRYGDIEESAGAGGGGESFSNKHPEADDFPGKEKRVDHQGMSVNESDFKEGVPQPTVDYSDGEGMDVTRAKGNGAVEESSVTTGQLSAPPSTKPEIKKGKVKKAGNAATAVKGMKNEGDVMKHKFENDDNIAEGIKLPAEIAKNVKKIMEHVQKQIAKFPNGRKMVPSYRTVIELNGKQKRTGTTYYLAEAAADAEELAVIGKGNVCLEVMLNENKQQKGMFLVEMPTLADRKPAIVAEGAIFRFQSIAKRVSQTIIGESIVHKVVSHPFGALIKGDVERLANRINENYGEGASSFTPVKQFDHPDQSGGITIFNSNDGHEYAVYWTEGDSVAHIVDIGQNARVGRITQGQAAPAEFQPMADALREPMSNARPMDSAQRRDHDTTMSYIGEGASNFTPVKQFDHPDQSGGITIFNSNDGHEYAVYWTEGDSVAHIVDIAQNARVGRIAQGQAAPAEFQPMADALREPMSNARPMDSAQRRDHDITMS